METNYRVFNLCLTILRCLGMSFSRLEKSKTGDKFVAKYSKIHLLFNMALMAGFLYILLHKSLYEHTPSGNSYKTSSIVFPLYTKCIVLAIVLFILWGNIYDRKFIAIINHFPRVVDELENNFGFPPYKDNTSAIRVFVRFFVYFAVATTIKIWLEFHLVINYRKVLRVMHYLCFFYGNLFTIHFIVTMNYIRENYGRVNHILKNIISLEILERTVTQQVSTISIIVSHRKLKKLTPRQKLSVWMTAFMELREVEGLVNEVFGKQIFLVLFLVFSGILINAYYISTMNLYGTGNVWMNTCFSFGLLECVTAAWANTRAAESAAREVNQISEIMYHYPLHVNNWEVYNLIKYFTIFSHNHPMQFKAWVFYTFTYESLFKVMVSSLTITVIILQCDFLRTSLRSTN